MRSDFSLNNNNDNLLLSHTWQEGVDQPGKVANPARGQLNRENTSYFPVHVRSRLRI